MKTLSTQEVAIDLGINIRSVQRYINQGFLPAIQTIGPSGQAGYVVEYFDYQNWKTKHFQGVKRGKVNKARRNTKEPNLNELKLLASEWLESLRLGTFNGKVYSPMTIECYKYQINKYWHMLERYAPRPYISQTNFTRILSQISIEHFASRQKLFDSIWCFMKYLVEKGMLEEAEMIKLKKLKPKRFLPAKKVTYTENQLEAILKANSGANGNGPYDKLLTEALVIVLANTGLRASELCDLRLEDVDLQQKTLYVWHGKGNKNRRIGLNNRVVGILEKYLLRRLEKAHSEHFFVTRYGEKLKT